MAIKYIFVEACIEYITFNCYTFSAHREQEDVSVFVVMYGKESEFLILGSSSITFKHDIACELACFLVSHANCLTPSSHHTLLSQFDLIERDLQSMDRDVMLAMAYEEIPSSWNIVGNSTEDGK